MIVSDKEITLGLSGGKVIGNILGSIDVITHGIDA